MKAKHIILGLTTVISTGCVTNPMTGKKSVQIVSDQEIANSAVQQYKETLSKSKVVKGTTAAQQVQNVGKKLQNAATKYYASIGRSDDLKSFNWEYNLIEENVANAWCMPGGKVAVFTGILPITKTETGMAVVLGHEISHALAGHGNQRVSSTILAQLGGSVLGASVSSGNKWGTILNKMYPYGAQVAILKYGRSQELEADEMGLYIMAMAGYDPREAQPFWHRMESASSGSQTPEFLSTHPTPTNRRAEIEKHLPLALKYYKTAGGKL